MSESGSTPTESEREASFDTVLAAERASEEALRACRVEANRIRQAASAQERRIAARTDERLQNLHTINQRRITDATNTLVTAFESERQSLAAAPDADQIVAAATRLARRLAGIDAP